MKLTDRQIEIISNMGNELEAAEALAAQRLKSLNAWKEAAEEKRWRLILCTEAAASRLELLWRENTIRFSRGKQCFFCDRYPLLNAKVGIEYEKVYIDHHADDCEWAKALVSEQSEEELGDEDSEGGISND